MSASETLKRLLWTDDASEDLEKALRLHEMLPQIIAVVEAAEDEAGDEATRLYRSLAALDEALT